MAKKSKRHYSIEKYLGMEIPKCFLSEVCEATTVYKNCDRSTLERECARMFAYITVMEKYIEEFELKAVKWQTGEPKEEGKYLVTTSNNMVRTAYWDNGCWLFNDLPFSTQKVKAWCKLSDIEPYKK